MLQRVRFFLSIAVLFASASVTSADWWFWPPETEIAPTCPFENESIKATFSGDWPDTCVPETCEYEIDGGEIRVGLTTYPDHGCGDAITPYSLTAEIGPLVADDYTMIAAWFVYSKGKRTQQSDYEKVATFTVLADAARGDINCDARIDFADIDPFVLVLTDPDAYAQQYPCCRSRFADINQDGRVDFDDIDGFVQCLIDGGCEH